MAHPLTISSNAPVVISPTVFLTVNETAFFIEFVKVPNGVMVNESVLLTGQYLSIPFIIFGLLVIGRLYIYDLAKKFLEAFCDCFVSIIFD